MVVIIVPTFQSGALGGAGTPIISITKPVKHRGSLWVGKRQKEMNTVQKSVYRALHITPLPNLDCPKCGQPINHIHRKWYERALSLFVFGLRRYSCSSPTCDWEGRVVFTD
jgi:hypothetical protein